jgi:hypothetical protein
MSTTLMPLDPATTPQRAVRVLTISANLLPEEIVLGRRARRTRTWVLAILVLVVALLAAWYVQARHERSVAASDLATAQKEAAGLQAERSKYKQVTEVQDENKAIGARLTQLFADDLSWPLLYQTLRTTGATSGVTIIDLTGKLADDTDRATGTMPSTAGVPIGSVTLGGTAPDKPSVAAFVDDLGKLGTVANPFVTTVSLKNQKGGSPTVTFTLHLDITAKALCGRYGTAKCIAVGGN